MFKRVSDFIMLSTMGMIMVSLFVLLFLVSIFFIMKSSELKGAGTNVFSSYFTNPRVTGTEISHYDSIAQNNIDILGEITPEEAEVFLFILRFSDSMNSTEARKLAALIIDECDKYDLNPFLILAVIQVESEFTPKAVSGQGAIGLMQVMPATGKFVAKELGISYSGKKTLYDPFINVKLGIHYLSFLADRFDSTENALAAYNYGPTRYESTLSLKKSPPKYVRKVLDFKNFLEEESILLAKRS
jgi:transglycosylase-like protein with SLT domain